MAILSPTQRLHVCVRFGLAAWLASMAGAFAQAQTAGPDYRIKAIFLYNFSKFVEWPVEAFADARSPLVIGVLGEDPFGSLLDEAARGEKANGHDLIVRRYRLVEEIDSCHILFISRSESGRIESVLHALRGRSILTVSDADDFARLGGMVRFVMENGRVRLRINLDAAEDAHLTISSKLLRSVQVVTPKN